MHRPKKSASVRCQNSFWASWWRTPSKIYPQACCGTYWTSAVRNSTTLTRKKWSSHLTPPLLARLEKTVASEIITNELSVENSVSKNLNDIIERHLATIQKQKRTVGKCAQEYEATRQKYDVSCDHFWVIFNADSVIGLSQSRNHESVVIMEMIECDSSSPRVGFNAKAIKCVSVAGRRRFVYSWWGDRVFLFTIFARFMAVFSDECLLGEMWAYQNPFGQMGRIIRAIRLLFDVLISVL